MGHLQLRMAFFFYGQNAKVFQAAVLTAEIHSKQEILRFLSLLFSKILFRDEQEQMVIIY
jgi:hypothetical protein